MRPPIPFLFALFCRATTFSWLSLLEMIWDCVNALSYLGPVLNFVILITVMSEPDPELHPQLEESYLEPKGLIWEEKFPFIVGFYYRFRSFFFNNLFWLIPFWNFRNIVRFLNLWWTWCSSSCLSHCMSSILQLDWLILPVMLFLIDFRWNLISFSIIILRI